jgi:hypothetical protein
MRCQQYQPIIADKCPCEAVCRECNRCAAHCFCDDMSHASRELRENLFGWLPPILPTHSTQLMAYGAPKVEAADEIRIADIAVLWDAGVRVSDDEFEGGRFKV